MSTPNSIVCEEVFDDVSHPSITEIRDYASKIGIDPDNEPQLLTLAAEGLMKALPPGWKPCLDEKSKSYYYYNNNTGKTQWEHPLDEVYRGLVKKKRTESQSLSLGEPTEDATYTRDDIPSLEEPLNPLTSLTLGARKKDLKLSPLKPQHSKLLRHKSEEKPIVDYVNRKVGLSLSSSFDGKNENFGEVPKKEFKLAGGGSMFLKSNVKKPEVAEDEISKPTDASIRGILRERSFIEPIDDDKKNVRFSLSNKIADQTDEKLKLIKIKPLEIDGDDKSDSDDESFIEKKADSLALSETSKNSIAEKYRDDNIAIINKIKQTADRELEDMKKTIWEQKNLEIDSYKEELHESQKHELQRMLTSTKLQYEENIKEELEKLKLEMESRNAGALEKEKIRLEEEFEMSKKKMGEQFGLEAVEKQLAEDFERKKATLQKKYDDDLEEMEKLLVRDLEKHKDELIVSHNAILDQQRKSNSAILEELKQDFKAEQRIIRKEHESQIADLRRKVSGNLDMEVSNSANRDVNEERLYEKVRCEKRLLEDKYRCLKEKYLRLKTDVKLSIEKRNRKREQSATTTTTTTTTTGSETERSNSINRERSPCNIKVSDKPPIQKDLNSNKHKSEYKNPRTLVIQDLDTSTSDRSVKTNDVKGEYDSSEENMNAMRSRKKLFSRLKSSSTGRTGNNNNNKAKKLHQPRACSPVENLRRQLQKLEDLEDQFPQNAGQVDTYHLRYPFSDGQKYEGSSELEFFRHRIHLERDSIKRAKESLRTQKCLFQQRQNDLKLKHGSMARHTLHQLCQEERDLTDMEVSLHRTRSLLGEKVIRLRHLEQSLQRATAASSGEQNRQEETTLSDLSSHSASSGISSTEFATAADGARTVLRDEHLQESSEIIQSLENLNSEIREIWEVLNQQQHTGNMASVMPLPLVYPDLGWPVLAGTATSVPAPPSIPTLADRLHNYRQHIALANAQSTVVTAAAANQGGAATTTSLVERTRNLRHWLRQAGAEQQTGDGTAAPQATL